MKKVFGLSLLFAVALLLASESALYAQTGSTSGGIGVQTVFVNPLVPSGARFVCGDLKQAGTAIAGDADGADNVPATADDGTSGVIPVAGIPANARVELARLFWTVLTDDAQTAFTGASITFDPPGPTGPFGIVGTKIATAGASPCFPQDNTLAYRADVTALVLSPGNGNYTVSGFPGGNAIGGAHFAEGATLQILWSNESAFRRVVSYQASGAGLLPVTNLVGDTFSQVIGGLTGSNDGVSARLYEVIGNGQSDALELLGATGGQGTVNFDNTLDGSSAGKAANSCSFTDQPGNLQCYWDDDTQNISAAVAAGDLSVTFNYQVVTDCHDFPALAVSVSTDITFGEYCAAGGAFVDAACPAAGPLGGGTWANHGDYVNCVSNAANQFVSNNDVACSTSCIVNPRARSNVGRGGRP